jgi:hypothetical protein
MYYCSLPPLSQSHLRITSWQLAREMPDSNPEWGIVFLVYLKGQGHDIRMD